MMAPIERTAALAAGMDGVLDGAYPDEPAAPEPSGLPAMPTITPATPGALSAVTRWVKRAESAEAQLAAVRLSLGAALNYANGRWSEWGERAETVRDKLEAIVAPGAGTGEPR